jgi:hypothetical protein
MCILVIRLQDEMNVFQFLAGTMDFVVIHVVELT